MQIETRHIELCISKAREIQAEYHRYILSPNVKKSVDDLLYILGAYLNKKIEVYILDESVEYDTIKAMYLSTNTGYEIYLLPGMDPTLQKFALCKELFHVVLDTDECWNLDIWGHLEDVWTTFPTYDGKPKPPAAFEFLAEAAAMEFLFPYRYRQNLTDAEKANGGALALAERFDVPIHMIELYCSDNAMAFFQDFTERE